MPSYKLWLVVEDKELTAYSSLVAASTNENAGVDLVTAENWVGEPGQPHLLDLRPMPTTSHLKR